jgi:hypothetical protein
MTDAKRRRVTEVRRMLIDGALVALPIGAIVQLVLGLVGKQQQAADPDILPILIHHTETLSHNQEHIKNDMDAARAPPNYGHSRRHRPMSCRGS